LEEIIAEVRGIAKGSSAVEREYCDLVTRLGTEFKILLEVPKEDLVKQMPYRIAEAILRVREEKVYLQPGFDGEYGKISIFGPEGKKTQEEQLNLF